MTVAIADLAREFEIKPGQVMAALDDLGMTHDQREFATDSATLDVLKDALTELIGSKEVPIQRGRTLRDIAHIMGLNQQDVQKTLFVKHKKMATLTTKLEDAVVEQLIADYGYKLVWADAPRKPITVKPAPKPKVGAQPRSPVVTIMGHVDHGKTSLLDKIRKTDVAASEHGGITQHIGAYQVHLPEGVITFLDTPGHAAFTAMRARGAQVTDIAVLVVAAEDGIMPQTIEAISHAKNARVPIIVAINKIDKPDANPDRVMTQLPEHGVVPEAYGGEVIVCPVSAATGEGIPHLLEMILLQAEMLQLTAEPKGALEGSVVEAKLEKGRGPVATVLVQQGTLKAGDALVVGNSYGRVRAMTDYRGDKVAEAGPSVPVEVLGLSDVPAAGDHVERVEDERTAREIAEERQDVARRKSLEAPARSLQLSDLRNRLAEGESKDLNLVVKADVHGSVEAVRGMLEKIDNEEVDVKVIHSAVGSITESDILLAGAAGAICVGFNVRPEPGAKKEAEKRHVEIRTYTIIYELVEDIEAAVKGMLEPKFEENPLGEIDIRVRFNLSKKGIIAGCYVTGGKVTRGAGCRVRRGKDVVYAGKVASLRHLKDDVREVTMGMECGVTFDGWEDFKEGDVIEAFELVQVNA